MGDALPGWELRAPLAYSDWMLSAWGVWSAPAAGQAGIAARRERLPT